MTRSKTLPTPEDIGSQLYDRVGLTQNQAARDLGLTSRGLQNACQAYGLKRWPYPTFIALQKYRVKYPSCKYDGMLEQLKLNPKLTIKELRKWELDQERKERQERKQESDPSSSHAREVGIIRDRRKQSGPKCFTHGPAAIFPTDPSSPDLNPLPIAIEDQRHVHSFEPVRPQALLPAPHHPLEYRHHYSFTISVCVAPIVYTRSIRSDPHVVPPVSEILGHLPLHEQPQSIPLPPIRTSIEPIHLAPLCSPFPQQPTSIQRLFAAAQQQFAPSTNNKPICFTDQSSGPNGPSRKTETLIGGPKGSHLMSSWRPSKPVQSQLSRST